MACLPAFPSSPSHPSHLSAPPPSSRSPSPCQLGPFSLLFLVFRVMKADAPQLSSPTSQTRSGVSPQGPALLWEPRFRENPHLQSAVPRTFPGGERLGFISLEVLKQDPCCLFAGLFHFHPPKGIKLTAGGTFPHLLADGLRRDRLLAAVPRAGFSLSIRLPSMGRGKGCWGCLTAL